MIQFVIHTAPSTKLAKHLVADLKAFNLEGDFLNGVPTMDNVNWYCDDRVSSWLSKPKFKYHNRIEVIRDANEITLVIVGAATDSRVKLCGFKQTNN